MSAILKHLEDLLRFNTTRNMRFNNQVHKLRKRDCNVRFHVVLVLKQTICVFVSGSIASFTNRVPYRLFACVEAQGSSSKALFNFTPRELSSITQAKLLHKRLFRVLLKSFLKLSMRLKRFDPVPPRYSQRRSRAMRNKMHAAQGES